MRILINVPTYNRKKTAEVCLANLYKYKQDCTVHVYNDWSTEYDNAFLEPYADKVFKLPESSLRVVKNEENKNGMGVQHLRWYQLRNFLDTDYDALYLTDADAIHDPSYVNVLKHLPNSHPISLYASRRKGFQPTRTNTYFSKYVGGISVFFTREMVRCIVDELNRREVDPSYAWDYHVFEYLNQKVRVTSTCYVEHLGAGGLHSGARDWNHDRAQSPTNYLQRLRDPAIAYIENRGQKPRI